MKCCSRDGEVREVEEMRKAVVELEYKNLSRWIDEMFYDSRACCCFISVVHYDVENYIPPWKELREVLDHHISQYVLGGIAYGKDFT